MPAVAVSVSLKSIYTVLHGGGGAGAAANLISGDANGFSLDFTDNSYAIQKNTGAETLLFADAAGFATDFTDNSYSVRS